MILISSMYRGYILIKASFRNFVAKYYLKKERAKYWPVSKELLAQYQDGSHTRKTSNGLYWQKNGLFHRDGDKPAIIFANGTLFWCQNSEIHRFRGPAVINPDGRLEWWINGEEITQEVNDWLNGEEWRGTPEQIAEFKFRFA